MALLATTLARAGHVRSFDVRPAQPRGWEVSERDGQRDLQRQLYEDWHQVERVLADFQRKIAGLVEQGWCELLNE